MADDKGKRDLSDRESAEDVYKVDCFANKMRISVPQLHELIRKHGSDRETLERESRKFRA
ncbi:DUF3606 domain-containing protein [Mesorhizobium sp.]|uniref:DUF3606 domain-containing protein n=1 Tax=Mesorhizobium sp. TaxID=1871066 RepID=UPI000FE39598|nr:DUF3606 domain-containing protein [Mesorhizobium sp.]RWH68111.1 MAG: DUF3606 domain-containing protein [Mesorhizobium sp.]RWL23929.1 MAG: DUF3606 domain-containing protein [Mesorhizobium sp.]RWL27091.1 MAG: DUF3606 domain-containing protein [Mesorhizobium sp.]RWL35376.1 MAG: DUF3606 domain-containing protein [Mesorhizobium sp.]RWL50623.1 MAG: DUF3606 domain-containing protein [Mesorhizobium sp.]